MHFRLPMFLCGTAALLLTGCNTAGKWISPLTQMGAAATTAATASSDGDRTNSEPVVSQSRTPASAKSTSAATAGAAGAAEKSSTTTTAASTSSTPLIQPGQPAVAPRPQFDSATLARIDAETRDASPDERAQLYRMLKDVNPSDIEQVLRVRRMSIEFRKLQQNGPPSMAAQSAAGTSGNATSPQSSPQIAAGERQPGNGAPGFSNMGLNHAADAQFGNLPPQSSGSPGTNNFQASVPGGIEQASYNTDSEPARAQNKNTGWTMKIGDTTNQVAATSRQHEVQSPVINAAAEHAASDRQPVIHAAAAVTAGDRPVVVPASSTAASNAASRNNGAMLPESTATLPAGISNSSSLSLLISELEAEVQQTPVGNTDAEHRQYTERHVMLRILYLLAGQQERAIQAIPSLEPADQEFWQQTLWGLANYFDKNPEMSAAARVSTASKAFNSAVIKLQERAALELRNVSFCDRILSYGNYQKFPVAEFTPGQPVLVYAELGNFVSERSQSGEYRTTLKSTLEIYRPGPNGELVEKIAIPNPVAEDLCRNQRRDFYLSYEFSIPSRLPPGPHVLKLIVEDQLSRKVSSSSVNFNVK